ncbi:hypothetical protein DIE16_20050 [Burkholderia sp. Bp9090]|uniref:hypothetical protein n=1 Tax=Burkholderia sp. Bp9090 TaxID=2184567 RepID=UPI000F5D5904|nr:hypothetical protein [Burkholderia sp. Bp9090]RQZ35702.1 hypothetical protein DIE16_20050 [Burkholderia sp. Bp9090]
MKRRYLFVGLFQLFLILLSGWLRRTSWSQIDFAGDTWPSSVQLSFYCLVGWLVTIASAIWFAVHDKTNRSMVVLFLVVLLPSIEFLLWFALSF